MEVREGNVIDLSAWLQWYAFDVIACITFKRRFGFLEEGRDIGDMIAALDFLFPYLGTIGQIPWLHDWLLGNKLLVSLIKWLNPGQPDPAEEFLKVNHEVLGFDVGKLTELDHRGGNCSIRQKRKREQ